MFSRSLPILALILATLLWSGNFVAARGVHEISDPLWLNGARWAVAALCLSPVLWLDRRAICAVLRSHPGSLLILSGLGIVGFNSVLYAGLETASATEAGVLFAVSPLLIYGITWAMGGRGPGRVEAVGSLIAFLGVCLLVQGGPQEGLSGDGALLVLLSAGIWAGYTVALRKLPVPLSALSLLAVQAALGALILMPALLFPPSAQGTLSWPLMGAVLYLGLGASVLAFWIWAHGVAWIGAGRAGAFLQLMPVFSALLAMGLLGERPAPVAMLGMVLAVTGVALANHPGLGSASRPCQKARANEGSPHAPRDYHPQNR
ncbi:DMT family transporter [Dinoroseobacter sp. S76]|uniref:DMT family transporter n=1 Tax=Dinoroseobacter sp. S76 TaxID=3415124 RepID=UPI003C7CABEB